MRAGRALRRAAVSVLALGCAQSQPAAAPPPAPAPAPSATPATPAIAAADTNAAGLVPAGYGTLRQEDIAIKLFLPDVDVRLTPLDESVIRTLSPDSYRALRELAESRRAAIARLAAQRGLLRGNLWYVSFFGRAPDARFSPLELTVTSGGHAFRPVEVLPLTTGFGEQRLQPRETQSAIYIFDDALDVNQRVVVSLGSQRSESWEGTLRTIERERVLIRSRVQRTGAPSP